MKYKQKITTIMGIFFLNKNSFEDCCNNYLFKNLAVFFAKMRWGRQVFGSALIEQTGIVEGSIDVIAYFSNFH